MEICQISFTSGYNLILANVERNNTLRCKDKQKTSINGKHVIGGLPFASQITNSAKLLSAHKYHIIFHIQYNNYNVLPTMCLAYFDCSYLLFSI